MASPPRQVKRRAADSPAGRHLTMGAARAHGRHRAVGIAALCLLAAAVITAVAPGTRAAVAAAGATAAAPATPLPARAVVPLNATWAVETVFANATAFDAELTAVTALLDANDTAAVGGRVVLLWVYASMQHDVDLNDDAAKAARARVVALANRAAGRAAPPAAHYAAGQLPPDEDDGQVALPAGAPWDTLEGDAPVAVTAAAAAEAEAVEVTVAGVLGASALAAKRAWTALVNTGLAFPPIRDGAGVERPVTASNFAAHSLSRDRVRREAALRSRNGEYGRHANTLGEVRRGRSPTQRRGLEQGGGGDIGSGLARAELDGTVRSSWSQPLRVLARCISS